MGWNLHLATESDRAKAAHLESLGASVTEDDYESAAKNLVQLSRSFSYAFYEGGEFYEWLTQTDVDRFEANSIDDPPAKWKCHDPAGVLETLLRVRETLAVKSAQLPVDHFLFFVDETGRRMTGSTQITIPWGGIALKVPHGPMVKLDGGHHDLSHRDELRVYDVRIDPALLAKRNREIEEQLKGDSLNHQQGVAAYRFSGRLTNPIVEEPAGWMPAFPVLDILDCRVEVKSVDAQSSFQPDFDVAIEYCERRVRMGESLYFLIG